MVEAAGGYVQAGRREAIHRRLRVAGSVLTATERCNLDDTDEDTAPREITLEEARAAAPGRFCRHCFPLGKPVI